MKTQNELNELKKEYEELNNKLCELTEEELKQVCGGFTSDQSINVTKMKCSDPNCGKGAFWYGNFLDQIFDCPRCGQHTFTGISYEA